MIDLVHELDALWDVPVGLALFDEQLRYIRVNRALAEIDGVAAEAHLGKTVLEVVPDQSRELVEQLQRVRDTGVLADVEVARSAASQPGVLRHWRTSLFPVRSGGRLVGVGAIVVEISDRKRAEEELRDKRVLAHSRAAQLQAVLDAVPAAVLMASNLDATHIEGNQFAQELFGVEPGGNFSKTSPQGVRMRSRVFRGGVEVPTEELPIRLAASRGVAVTGAELEILRDDGKVRYVAGNATPLKDEQGKPYGAVGAFVDVTQAKEAELAARHSEAQARALAVIVESSEERLRLALESARMGVWEIELASCSIAWDARAKELFGFAPHEEPTYQEVLAAIPAEDRSRVERAIEAAISPHSPGAYRIEHRTVWPDGSTHWVLVRGQAYFGAEAPRGRAVRMSGTVLDATELKRAEDALQGERALQFVASILEGLPNPVFVKDERHRWVVVNDKFCRMVGRARGQLLGRSDPELFPGEQAEHFWRTDDLVFSTGGVEENEERLTDLAGNSYIIIARKTLYVDPAGHRFLLGVITDITHRKQVEEELRRSRDELEHRVAERTAELRRMNDQLSEQDRRKNEFLAVLSHELRNPLAPLRNSLWLLDHASPGGERALRAKDTINRQVIHLTRLIDDLLDVTRISRGKIRLQRTRVDLCEVVRRTVEDHKTLFAAREVSLSVDTPAMPQWLDADATRLSQVIGNLLSNAAKFSRPGGHVAVVVERGKDRTAELRVRDDGTGIQPAFLERIFEPFIQADTTLHRTRGGLGLGLSLVKGLVELHGGSVKARSEGPERGAEFEVRLPLAAEDPAVRAPARSLPVLVPRRRVLVIEDNVDAAETLREMLTIWEQDVEVAHDGLEGLAKVRAFRPEVVLCDIGLPAMDGYEVARAIRADAELASTFLVALTGYASLEDQRRAADAGFNRHLAKPVPVEVVEEVLVTAPRIADPRPS